MKKILFLFLLVVPVLSFAESYPYDGTWVYQSNDTVFKIKLVGRGSGNDLAYYGNYSLTVKGELVEDYMKPFSFPLKIEHLLDLPNVGVYIYFFTKNDYSYVYFRFFDQKIKHNKGNGIVAGSMRFNATRDTIRWEMDEFIEWRHDVNCFGVEEFAEQILKMFPKPPAKGFSVPTHALLVRVNEEDE